VLRQFQNDCFLQVRLSPLGPTATAQRTPHPFDVILVRKFSRFARNREDSAFYKRLLRRRGAEVISVSWPVDRDSAASILTEGMIEVIDQFYSARLAEDVRRGQTETTLDGFSTGGWPPFGYRRVEVPDPRGRQDRTGQPVIRVTVEIEPAEAAIVLRVFETYAAGAGYKKIVRALNRESIPGPRGGTRDVSAVREIQRNNAYRGARAYGRVEKVRTAQGTRSKRSKPAETWRVKEAAHPAIVCQDLWDRVRRKREHVAQVHREHGMAQAQLPHTQSLLAGILTCGVCGGHFIIRGGYMTKAGRARHYGCGTHAGRGDVVCPNRRRLPQAAVERDLLEVLLGVVLTPQNLERLLGMVNTRLRAQAAENRPRIQELRRAIAKVDREITNYTRAVAHGDFASLETALAGAERRRATLRAELAALEQAQPMGVVQLTPAALQHHLQGIIEKLRSGVAGRVREAIEQSVARIVVAADGTLTLVAKPDGLLGVNGTIVPLVGRESGPIPERPIRSGTGRQWKVIGAG
jgi:site-specific DNA recombinase